MDEYNVQIPSASVYSSKVEQEIDTILQQLTESFSELEIKKVVGFTKSALGGEFLKFPDDEVSRCFGELRNQGRIGSKDTELLCYYAEHVSKNTSIKDKVERLNRSRMKNKECGGEFVGREEDVGAIVYNLTSRKTSVLNLYGDPGVGKTTLAEHVAGIMGSENIVKFQGKVNLRQMKDQRVLCSGILHAFNSPNILKPCDKKVYEVIENLEVSSIIILDNAEDMLDQGHSEGENIPFCDLLKGMVEHDKHSKLTILLTSRVPLPDKLSNFSDYYVKPLKQTSSVKVFDNINLSLSTSQKNEISWLCKNKPLNLKLIRGVIEEKLLKPEDVRANLEKKNVLETVDKSERSKESIDIRDNNVISEAFDKCTTEMKKVAIKMSLFQRPFSVEDAQKMLEQSCSETTFLLCTLKNRGFLHQRGNERKCVTYEMHPLINKFLTETCNEKNYQEIYSEAKETFCKMFLQKAKEICSLLEKDYMNAYSKIEMERLNLLLAFQISFERGFLYFSSDYSDISIVVDLYTILIPGQEREHLFKKWCKIAHCQGEWITFANLVSRQILVLLEKSTRSMEAQQLLDTVEEALSKVTVTSYDSYRLAESSYYYAKAGIAHLICSSKKPDVWEGAAKEALKFYKKSLKVREEILKDHTDTARTLNAIGNCYMQLNDLYCANEYYTRALAMRRRLTGSDMHTDMPVYINQIAAVHERMGKLYLKRVRQGSSKAERKKLTKLYRLEFYEALARYQEALDLEKKLHISGYLTTATLYRNMSNIYSFLEEGELSLKAAKKALSLRKKLLGLDADTIRSYYQVGLVYEKLCKNDQCLKYFYKAYMMEQRLPVGGRSAVKEHVLSKIENNLGSIVEAESYDKRHKEAISKGCFDDEVMTSEDEDDEQENESPYSGSSFEKTFKDSDSYCQSFTLGVQEGFYELSQLGILLEWPPNVVTCPTQIEFREISPPFCPAPAKDNETLVSYIVKLGPSNVELQELITISLIHSGASRKDGYETIVKTFDGESCYEWKEVLTEKSRAKGCRETDHVVRVKIDKLSSLAVVGRLVKDRFEVTEKGCVVRSSVCNDVTVEFPEGAVDKTVNGSMKLQLMPDKVNIDVVAYPGPAILMDGFEDVKFNVPVIITLPHPHAMDYCSGEVHVFHLEDRNPNSNNWKDISGQIRCVEKTSHIQLHVDHFCWLWVWIYKVPLACATSLFQHLFINPPQAVCFAVFKEACEYDFDYLTMTLVCVANHKQTKVASKMRDEGYTRLALSTADKLMRPFDKAYTKVEGCYRNIREVFFLQFLKNEVCRKDLTLFREEEDQEEGNIKEDEQVARGRGKVITVKVLSFLENLEEKEEHHFCTFIIDTAKIIHREIEEEKVDSVQTVETVGLESAPPEPSDTSCQELFDFFGIVHIKCIDASTAAAKVYEKLQLNRLSMEDPPDDVVKKCRYFCQNICKMHGRLDIIKELRILLPSGITGPLKDDRVLYQQMKAKEKRDLTFSLCDQNLWQRLGDELNIPRDHLNYYDRQRNPVEELLAEVCKTRRLSVGELYDVLLKCDANALADKYL